MFGKEYVNEKVDTSKSLENTCSPPPKKKKKKIIE